MTSTTRPAHRHNAWLAAILALTLTTPAQAGQFVLRVVDRDTGQPLVCRMHLMGANNRPRKVDKTINYHDHFVVDGKISLKLPNGQYTFELDRGPEYATRQGHFAIEPFADDEHQVDLKRHVDMAAAGWYSGDLFVRRPVADARLLMLAEDLHVAEIASWWNDQAAKPSLDAKDALVTFDGNRVYNASSGGLTRPGTTLLLLGMPAPPKPTPGEHPVWPKLLSDLRQSHEMWVDSTAPYWWDLPMLVAHGQIDSIELAYPQMTRQSSAGNEGDGRARDRRQFPDPWGNAQWSGQIYFQLLECGLRIPPSAGSGSGIAPNPLGYNRMYVHVDGPLSREKWFENLRAGRVTVTNGPLLQPSVGGQLPGYVFTAPEGNAIDLELALTLSTREPISYLEIIKNGRVEQSIRFEDYAKTGQLPRLTFDRSGWLMIRAVTDLPKTYRFAVTAPYYVEVGYERRVSKKAATFFLDWANERTAQIEKLEGGNRDALLECHRKACEFWQRLVDDATVE